MERLFNKRWHEVDRCTSNIELRPCGIQQFGIESCSEFSLAHAGSSALSIKIFIAAHPLEVRGEAWTERRTGRGFEYLRTS